MPNFTRTTICWRQRRVEHSECRQCGWQAFGTSRAVNIAQRAHICAPDTERAGPSPHREAKSFFDSLQYRAAAN